MLGVVVPLWPVSSKVEANGQLADYILLSQMLKEKSCLGQACFSIRQ
jgi:hypothetical protein